MFKTLLDEFRGLIPPLQNAYIECFRFKEKHEGRWDTREKWEFAYNKAKTAEDQVRRNIEDASVQLLAAADRIKYDVPAEWLLCVVLGLRDSDSIESGREVLIDAIDKGTTKAVFRAVINMRLNRLILQGRSLALEQEETETAAEEEVADSKAAHNDDAPPYFQPLPDLLTPGNKPLLPPPPFQSNAGSGWSQQSPALLTHEVDAGTPRECYARDHLFLEWHESKGQPTYHSRAKIRDKWNAMDDDARAVINPDNFETVTIETVNTALKKAKKERKEKQK